METTTKQQGNIKTIQIVFETMYIHVAHTIKTDRTPQIE